MRRTYLVAGRVQGVGFRRFVQRKAQDLGVSGYAANLPDGRVEVLADGDEERLLKLEEWLRRGPSMSHVTDVRSSPAPTDIPLDGFTCR